MSKYRIAWLPGDGVGQDVMEAAKIVLDRMGLDAEYVHGDIGWEFWCREGEALPQRTLDLMKETDCAFFGAITSKGKDVADKELDAALQGKQPVVGPLQAAANVRIAYFMQDGALIEYLRGQPGYCCGLPLP